MTNLIQKIGKSCKSAWNFYWNLDMIMKIYLVVMTIVSIFGFIAAWKLGKLVKLGHY